MHPASEGQPWNTQQADTTSAMILTEMERAQALIVTQLYSIQPAHMLHLSNNSIALTSKEFACDFEGIAPRLTSNIVKTSTHLNSSLQGGVIFTCVCLLVGW